MFERLMEHLFFEYPNLTTEEIYAVAKKLVEETEAQILEGYGYPYRGDTISDRQFDQQESALDRYCR